MYAAFAGIFLTVSGLGTVAQIDGPLRESDTEAALLEAGSGEDAAEPLELQNLRRVLRRQQLALAAGLDPAASMSRDWRADSRQRSALRQALGHDRWRRLGDARFQLQLREVQGYNEHRDLRDLPIIYEQVEDSLRSNFGKLARDYLEERLGIDDMLDRGRDRLRGRLRGDEAEESAGGSSSSGLRISPRVSIGNDSYLGAKFQLRSSPFLRRFGLRVSQSLDSDELALKLTYEHGLRRLYFEQRLEDPERGDTTVVGLRMAF